jgi:O-antigen ligase
VEIAAAAKSKMDNSSENLVLGTVMETGVFGGGLLLALLVWGCWRTVELSLRLRDRPERDAYYLVALCLTVIFPVGILASLTFLVEFNDPTIWMFFGLSNAVIAHSLKPEILNRSPAPSRAKRAALRQNDLRREP